MRWLLLAICVARAAEPGYVDSAECRRCHTAIYDSYRQTGMGRSFGPVVDVPPLARFDHRPSRQSFAITRRGDASYMTRAPSNDERRIDFVVGSGNHAKTFLSKNVLGVLFQLPVSWYAEGGGAWHMSPGFDRPDHSAFHREVPDSCMFCHNGYPSDANGGLAKGIDCQRCHGPGGRHLRERGPIVNPAKLSSERRLEVCLQCHLESAGRTLPDAVRTPGRGVFSYRPGEPLSDYTTYYEYMSQAGDDRITVNGAGHGMLKSACFQQSKGQLSCTTCHDPHRRLMGASAETHFTQVCRSCHAASHGPERRNCTNCHMQKRRTEDAVHTVMTDHRIRRRPLSGAQTGMIAERHDRMSGPVKLLYPPSLPDTPSTRLYRAMAQGDAELLRRSVAEAKPAQAEPYFALGEAFKKAGRTEEAIGAFRAAAERSPWESAAFVAAAELMMAHGESAGAIALLEPALQRMPRDVQLLNSLAILYVDRMRIGEAAVLLATAVQVNPEDPHSWLNLGVCREASGDRQGAIAAYRTSLTLQPDLARARQFLDRVSRNRP